VWYICLCVFYICRYVRIRRHQHPRVHVVFVAAVLTTAAAAVNAAADAAVFTGGGLYRECIGGNTHDEAIFLIRIVKGAHRFAHVSLGHFCTKELEEWK